MDNERKETISYQEIPDPPEIPEIPLMDFLQKDNDFLSQNIGKLKKIIANDPVRCCYVSHDGMNIFLKTITLPKKSFDLIFKVVIEYNKVRRSMNASFLTGKEIFQGGNPFYFLIYDENQYRHIGTLSYKFSLLIQWFDQSSVEAFLVSAIKTAKQNCDEYVLKTNLFIHGLLREKSSFVPFIQKILNEEMTRQDFIQNPYRFYAPFSFSREKRKNPTASPSSLSSHSSTSSTSSMPATKKQKSSDVTEQKQNEVFGSQATGTEITPSKPLPLLTLKLLWQINQLQLMNNNLQGNSNPAIDPLLQAMREDIANPLVPIFLRLTKKLMELNIQQSQSNLSLERNIMNFELDRLHRESGSFTSDSQLEENSRLASILSNYSSEIQLINLALDRLGRESEPTTSDSQLEENSRSGPILL